MNAVALATPTSGMAPLAAHVSMAVHANLMTNVAVAWLDQVATNVAKVTAAALLDSNPTTTAISTKPASPHTPGESVSTARPSTGFQLVKCVTWTHTGGLAPMDSVSAIPELSAISVLPAVPATQLPALLQSKVFAVNSLAKMADLATKATKWLKALATRVQLLWTHHAKMAGVTVTLTTVSTRIVSADVLPTVCSNLATVALSLMAPPNLSLSTSTTKTGLMTKFALLPLWEPPSVAMLVTTGALSSASSH